MFKFLGSNPLAKTLFSQLIGVVAAAADGYLQAGPSGGSQAWLLAHPAMVPLYVFFSQATHIYLSKYAPPTIHPTDTQGGIATK